MSGTRNAQTRGAVAVESLAVSGNASVGGTFDATGNATLGGTLAVTGDVTLSANLILPGFKVVTQSQTFTEADFTAAAVTESVAVASPPTKAVPLWARIKLNTAFSGGGAGSCTAEIGDAGDTDGKMTATNVFTGQTTGVILGANGAEALFAAVEEAAYTPLITLTADVNVADLTAGSVTVYITYLQPVVP